MARHQALLKAPPKTVFQFLSDPTLLEEISRWKVDGPDTMAVGTAWIERRGLRRRTWTVTTYDRRGLAFSIEGPVAVTFACKKGGPGSCNVQMDVAGDPKAVARFERTDGDRLDRLAAWLA